MSSGSNKQFKQFTISCVQDACMVLGMLISGVIVNLEKYKEYASEAFSLLEKVDSEYVSAKEYDDINDKLLHRQHEILKLTADHQKSSFSYMDLREMLMKKNFITSPLSQGTSGILSELLDIRNWTFHNPQSLMVAAKEVAEKSIPKELIGVAKITPQLNPVPIQKVVKYEWLMLASLVFHTEKHIDQFEKVLSSMKADYQEMFDSISDKPYLLTAGGISTEVQYVEIPTTSGLSDHGSDMAQISMAIQKSKYDGSEEKFKEWVLRFGESEATSSE